MTRPATIITTAKSCKNVIPCIASEPASGVLVRRAGRLSPVVLVDYQTIGNFIAKKTTSHGKNPVSFVSQVRRDHALRAELNARSGLVVKIMVAYLSHVSAALKMVECGRCRVKNFIPGDLPAMETVPCTKCGHPVIVPVQLRQFELRSVIASGGMGTVYRAYDLNLHRQVAIKLVKPEMASDREIMDSFFREARAGAALNHTNIIHIYTFDEHDGQVYLAMELADSGSLDSWIERDGRVPELNVLDVGIKIASALSKALQHGLLHRDIKPNNILFNDEGEPKLVDFGLAGADAALDSASFVYGTPEYIAPEKVAAKGETFLSDMYSLGATLYHALTGHVPFDAPTESERAFAHVQIALTPPNQVVPDITGFTNDAITKTMAKDPAERFQSYEEMQMALEAARSHLLVSRFQAEGGTAAKGWWR